MLKKVSVLLFVLLLAAGTALAEGYDEPAMKNPRDRYEAYMEETDGSETLVLMMLDAMNDESALIRENGPLRVNWNYMDVSGEIDEEFYVTLIEGEYGHIAMYSTRFDGYDIHEYIIGEERMVDVGGAFKTRESGISREEWEWMWESYIFPYADFEMMHGMRQDENGYSYMLLRDAAGDLYEHVLGKDMRILEIRQYSPDENGDMVYKMRVTFSHIDDWEIPDTVIDRMVENAKESGTGNK